MAHTSYMSKSLMPSLVGWVLGAVGVVSTASTMLGTPIIDTPMGNGGDSVASMAVLVMGVAINYSRSTVAAWLGAALCTTLLVWTGVNFNAKQAARIVEATATAAKAAALASSNVVATTAESSQWESKPEYRSVRPLTPSEFADCDSGKAWTKKPAGIRNCTLYYEEGVPTRYIWELYQ